MCKRLLEKLNGGRNGRFAKIICDLPHSPRIAWYPSAGEDFRDLLYLSPQYSQFNPGTKPDVAPPDIFLHTDYFPNEFSHFLDIPSIHFDPNTSVRVRHTEELPSLNLPLDSHIVDLGPSKATNRVIYLELDVSSTQLNRFGEFRPVPVIYAFCENAAFCNEVMLPSGGHFSHVVHVRFGGSGCGGGRAAGSWILPILNRLGCEVFVTDGKHHVQDGDRYILDNFKNIRSAQQPQWPNFITIRKIPQIYWSGNGDVVWNLLSREVPQL